MVWRPIGLNKNIRTEFIQKVGELTFYSYSISTPLFGFLADKVPYRFLLSFVSISSLFCNFFFCYSFNNEPIFLGIVVYMNFIVGAYCQIIYPHYMKVFGMKYYIEVSGIIGLSNAILSPLCSVFAFCIEKYIENKDFAYKIIFNSSAGLGAMSFILGLFESEEEFNYDN